MKQHKRFFSKLTCALLMLVCTIGIFNVYVRWANKRPVALMYHLISEDAGELAHLYVTPENFEAQVKALSDMGYTFLFSSEYETGRSKRAVITFDDGYADNYTAAFPILKKYGAKATIFLVSGAIDIKGYLTTAEIKEMAASGLVEFGSHTVNHHELNQLSVDEIRSEMSGSSRTIAALTGKPTRTISYPNGAYNQDVMTCAQDYFTRAYLAWSGQYFSPYAIPRIPVVRDMELGVFMTQVLRSRF